MSPLISLVGISVILLLAYLASNNRKAINFRLVGTGLVLQVLIALFVLKTPVGTWIFGSISHFIVHYIEYAANEGSKFVFGFLTNQSVIREHIGENYQFIFFFNLIAALIFISLLMNLLYYFGIMQRAVRACAFLLKKFFPVSGSEAVSSIGSAIVGQIEAQIMIKPYLKTMSFSELHCSMVGSLACISGSIMIVYISLGIPAVYMMAASLMAIPGGIVIAKIVYPETEVKNTSAIQTNFEKPFANFLDAISSGCNDGLKIGFNVAAMLIGFLALIKLIDLGIAAVWAGGSLKIILSWLFTPLVYLMGIPKEELLKISGLIGEKLVINEFVAFIDLKQLIAQGILSEKTIAITSIALCSFANFSSVGIQIGGIGALAPERRRDLATLGMRALFCGTLVSYMSACIANLILW